MARALPTTLNPAICTDEVSHRFATAKSAVEAVNAAACVSIEGLGDEISVHFRTGSQYYTPKNRDQRRAQQFHYYGHFPHAPAEKQTALCRPFVDGPNDTNPIPSQPFQHGGGPQMPTTIAPRSSPGGMSLGVLPPHSIDATYQTMVRQGEANPPTHSGVSVLPYRFPPVQGSSSLNANADQIDSQQHQQGRRFSASLPHPPSRDFSRHPSTLPRNVVPRGQPSHRDFPKGTVPTGYPPPPMPFTLRVAPGSPTPAPRGSANKDGEGTIDYGTVRVRPGKAKYMAIPSDWRRDSTSLQPVDEAASKAPLPSTQDSQIPTTDKEDSSHLPNTNNSQPVQAADDCQEGNRDQPCNEGQKEVVSSNHLASEALHDSNIHAKRKASETEKDNEIFGQTWPKKKLAQIAQPDKSEKGSPPSQCERQHLDGQAGGHGSSKSETGNNNKNKNENRQEPDLQPSTTQDSSFGVGPPEAQTFEPTIAASRFPSYPKEAVQKTGQHTTGPNVSDTIATSVSVCKPAGPPPSPKFRRSEPFPAYQDLLYGNQSPKKDQKNTIAGHEDNKSASRNASTAQKNEGKSLKKLNPGAQNFVPPSRDASSLDSTSMPPNQASSLPTSLHGDSLTAPVVGQFPPQTQPFSHQAPLQMVYMPTPSNVAIVPSTDVQLHYPHGSNNRQGMLEYYRNNLSGQYHHSLPQVANPDGNGRIMSHDKYKGRPGGFKHRKNGYWKRNRFPANRDAEGANPSDESSKSKGSGKEDSSSSETLAASDNGKGAGAGSTSASTSTMPATKTKAAKSYNNKHKNQDKSADTKPSDDQSNAAASSEPTNRGKRKGRNFTTKHQKYKEPEKGKDHAQEKGNEKGNDVTTAAATVPPADDFPALPPPPVATTSTQAAASTTDPSKSDSDAKAKNKPT